MPLTSEVVEGYKHEASDHLPSQKEPLTLRGHTSLVDHMQQGSEWERYGAALTLRVLFQLPAAGALRKS